MPFFTPINCDKINLFKEGVEIKTNCKIGKFILPNKKEIKTIKIIPIKFEFLSPTFNPKSYNHEWVQVWFVPLKKTNNLFQNWFNPFKKNNNLFENCACWTLFKTFSLENFKNVIKNLNWKTYDCSLELSFQKKLNPNVNCSFYLVNFKIKKNVEKEQIKKIKEFLALNPDLSSQKAQSLINRLNKFEKPETSFNEFYEDEFYEDGFFDPYRPPYGD